MTAVEWLIQEHFGGIENCTPDFRNKIEQAKLMEKEHIMKANEEGFYSGQSMSHNGYCSFESSKDYYNKTFKSE